MVGIVLISSSLITELLIIFPHMHKILALMKGVASRKVAWRGSAEGVNNNKRCWQDCLFFSFPPPPPHPPFLCSEHRIYRARLWGNPCLSKAALLLWLCCRLVCCWDIMFVRRSLRNLEVIATLFHPLQPSFRVLFQQRTALLDVYTW